MFAGKLPKLPIELSDAKTFWEHVYIGNVVYRMEKSKCMTFVCASIQE